MKHWHKILAVALLISAACLTGCEAKTGESSRNRVSILPWVGWQRESKETRFLKSAETAPISEAALPVVLPEKAEAILREGTAKQGQLSRVSAEQLILALAGQEISVPIKDVTEVKFTGEVRFMSNGKLVVRGKEKRLTVQRNKLSNFYKH